MNTDNILKDCFDQNKLETLLVANWTQFFNSSKLMNFVIQNATNHLQQFSNINVSEIKPKGKSITISLCSFSKTSLVFWVDFYLPLTNLSYAEGTTEINLNHDGIITHLKTIGNIFSK